jgi:hypothetical protein
MKVNIKICRGYNIYISNINSIKSDLISPILQTHDGPQIYC